MITEIFITILLGLVSFATGFLPSFTGVPTNVESAFTTILPYLSFANSILPIDHMLTAWALTMSIYVSVLGFKLIEWVISKIWPTGQMKLPL